MKIRILSTIVLLLLAGTTLAQECGPFCPVCSGTGSSTGALISPGTIIPSFLYIPNGDEEKGVFNVRGGVTSWLDVGIGYTVETEKVLWSARLQVLREKEAGWRPAVIIGTGSVRIGSSDQSAFVQLTKSWEFNETFALRLSAGAATLLPDREEYFGLAGMTLTITDRWSPFVTYDGIKFHPGLSWFPTDWLTLAAILVESKEPAVSVGFRYSFKNNDEE